MTNLSASGFASSSVKPRPRNGWRCSVEKNDGVTASERSCSGLPPSLRLAVRPVKSVASSIGGRLRLAIDVVGNRHAGLVQIDALVAVPDEDQPVRIRIRQRPQQRLVEQAENRRVRADAQRERQDRDQGENGLLAERPEGIAEVLHGRLDGSADVEGCARRDLLLRSDREPRRSRGGPCRRATGSELGLGTYAPSRSRPNAAGRSRDDAVRRSEQVRPADGDRAGRSCRTAASRARAPSARRRALKLTPRSESNSIRPRRTDPRARRAAPRRQLGPGKYGMRRDDQAAARALSRATSSSVPNRSTAAAGKFRSSTGARECARRRG